jgi:hypothetical protein
LSAVDFVGSRFCGWKGGKKKMTKNEIAELARQYRANKSIAQEIEEEQEKIKGELIAELAHRGVDKLRADVFEIRNIAVTVKRFDAEKLKKEQGELLKSYMLTVETTRFQIA